MTDIEICNLALGHLASAGIASFEDDSDQARACASFYGPMRDAVLEDAIWSFAKAQYALAPRPAAPAFAWAYQFDVPSTVAKVWRVSSTPETDDDGTPWEMQGGVLLADVSPLYVTVTVNVTDTSLFSAAFCVALAARIAAELCIPLTENRALHGDLWQIYQRKITDAQGVDKSQGSQRGVRSPTVDMNALKWRR